MRDRQSGATRVVVLGGGFGGLEAARRLQRCFPSKELHLTLVSRENFFLFTPMLHEVAASDVDITHIVNPVRKLLRTGVFFAGEVEAIDLHERHVTVSHADGGHRHVLEYDHLILALGSVTSFHGIPGLAGRAFTMKSLGDAMALRNHLIERLEEADFECSAGQRHDLLSVVVAGGGFAGVETVAAVNDFLREALAFYPHLSEGDVRVALVHGGPVILPELSSKLGTYAQRQLSRRGVQLHMNVAVTGVSETGVELSDGSTVSAGTLVWTAGTRPNPLLEDVPCEKDRGRIKVTPDLQVPEWPGVWAVGDCAAIPDPQSGGWYPPTAQHALREGRVVAQNVAAAVRGKQTVPFRFATLGQLAAIGRRTGVANILGVNFSGFVAWWLWRTIYLAKLPRLERKVRVALDWTLDLLFSKDLVQFQTSPARTLGSPVPPPPAASAPSSPRP